jgi:tetratricopeptide (TPR) repeat protein
MARERAAAEAEIASARWLAASVLLEHGDSLWNLEAAGVLVASPGAPEATLALDALIHSGIEVATLEAAYVRYRTRDNDAATALYETALVSSLGTLDRAVATFYLGALAERVPDGDLAIDYYGETLSVGGTTYLTDDTLWWLGLLLEERGDYVAASDAFRHTRHELPQLALRQPRRDS